MEDHMSLIRNGYAVSARWGFLGVFFSALLALALFDPGAATAQEVKQIKLTEKHIQGFMAASKDMARLYDGADPDKPDPKVDAQAAAVAKKNGFASLAKSTNPFRRRKRKRSWRNSRLRSRTQSPFSSRKTSR
jgi:hypothetical protein